MSESVYIEESEIIIMKTTKNHFHSVIRALEKLYNAGVTTQYDKDQDVTNWFLGSHIVGLSGGVVGASKYYKLLESI